MDINPIVVIKRFTPEVSGSSLIPVVMVVHLSSFTTNVDSLPQESVSLYKEIL